MSIQFGLGNVANEFLVEVLDVSLPLQVIDQLNNKAGINADNEIVFDHEGYSGRFGELDGEMTWNGGKNHATYRNEIENNGLKGSHKYTSRGDVEDFWANLFGVHSWETYEEEGEISWDIDPVNFSADFAWNDSKKGTSVHGNTASMSCEMSLGVETEITNESFSLTFSPEMKTDGIDNAKKVAPEMVSHVDHGDIDYSGTLGIEIPALQECEKYFTTLTDECVINFTSSDIPKPIVMKMKNKFAFVKLGPHMAYVKSEDRQGKMVGFDRFQYLSFYFTQKAGRPFATIKKSFDKVGEDLKLTIPLHGAFQSHILPASMVYAGKWGQFFGNLFADMPESIVKAVYWMDKWVPSVKKSTFDISDIVAATRIGCGEYPNTEIQEDFKAFAEEIAQDMNDQEFGFLEDTRDFVNEVVDAEDEATAKFILPA